ncbi:energy-coupling factor transporter transmembrane protein EcfT [Acidaminobacter sp. JC074]|uniref:energy-coupling factor transporter transmembrane component T family protein n=1 Tax=Acidaminobacter sp. JC074 TaxID=2530199 RepID=UPI001F113C37|nr:energy-coupling factor transporter transmembrane protein EcfT [Acidaminobacter sp. JC074]MCH4888097.1 energy-coupling factor transporter transmembrane protein EcfT [Acidaminobacter sp. JC074]
MKIDPRTKLFVVLVISTLAIILNDILAMLFLFVLGTVMAKFFGGHFFLVLKRLRKMLSVIIGLIIIQSLFTGEGLVILQVGGIKLLTDIGLTKGMLYLLRVMIILVSGTILTTSTETELIGALIKIKIPYDFAFMVAIGIRFMPIFVEEFKDTMTAIELRGVDVKGLKLKKKLDLYGYIMTPIVIGALEKAKRLSLSIEMRGFRAMEKRTSHLKLKMKNRDYIIMAFTCLMAFLIV